jgi:hypothetical protein
MIVVVRPKRHTRAQAKARTLQSVHTRDIVDQVAMFSPVHIAALNISVPGL